MTICNFLVQIVVLPRIQQKYTNVRFKICCVSKDNESKQTCGSKCIVAKNTIKICKYLAKCVVTQNKTKICKLAVQNVLLLEIR